MGLRLGHKVEEASSGAIGSIVAGRDVAREGSGEGWER